MSYQPRVGSIADRTIKHLQIHGPMALSTIADQIDAEEASMMPSLTQAMTVKLLDRYRDAAGSWMYFAVGYRTEEERDAHSDFVESGAANGADSAPAAVSAPAAGDAFGSMVRDLGAPRDPVHQVIAESLAEHGEVRRGESLTIDVESFREATATIGPDERETKTVVLVDTPDKRVDIVFQDEPKRRPVMAAPDPVPAVVVPLSTEMDCWLTMNGTFVCIDPRGGRVELQAEDTKRLLHYLDRIRPDDEGDAAR